jgi:hypothetical protein
MNNLKHEHDHNGRDEHANDNAKPGEKAVASVPAGGASTSLAALDASTSLIALGAALKAVDTTSVGGGAGIPMLSFKREGDGTWKYGQKQIVVEDGSRWAVNPQSFRYGYICFGDGNKVLGERLVPVSQPMPAVEELPDKGFPWVPQWCVNLKCLDGEDADVEATYKPTTQGGIQSVAGLIEAVGDRINGGQHDRKVSPIVLLKKASYQHPQYGRVWKPLLDIVDWIFLSGPAPAPAPTSPPPAEQPRRRRVA